MHTCRSHRPGEQLLLPLLSVHTKCNANRLIYYQVVNKYKTYPTQDQVLLDVYIVYSYVRRHTQQAAIYSPYTYTLIHILYPNIPRAYIIRSRWVGSATRAATVRQVILPVPCSYITINHPVSEGQCTMCSATIYYFDVLHCTPCILLLIYYTTCCNTEWVRPLTSQNSTLLSVASNTFSVYTSSF